MKTRQVHKSGIRPAHGYPLSRPCLCACVFTAALIDAVARRIRIGEAPGAASSYRLRILIYVHFATALATVAAMTMLIHRMHRRLRTYYLIISHNENGMQQNPPGVRMALRRLYRCNLHENPMHVVLPPEGARAPVYPMLMQSDRAGNERSEQFLHTAYTHAGRTTARICYHQPAVETSPWPTQAAYIRPLLHGDSCGILIVAHGSRTGALPREPVVFRQRLRRLLPHGPAFALSYINNTPTPQETMLCIHAADIFMLPFLPTDGCHYEHDLPTMKQAAARDKRITLLSTAGKLPVGKN